MSDTLEVNLPTYQMEPDPPRFPVRKLVKYVGLLLLLGGGYTYRAEIIDLLRTSFARFEDVMGPQRDVAPRGNVVPPPLKVVPPPLLPADSQKAISTETWRPAKPRGNPWSWVTKDDYPTHALRQNLEGTTKFTLIIGSDGRVQNCMLKESSGSADLDEAACAALTRRGHFYPATDGNGNPTEGQWSRSVRWQIPVD